jgi:hypothetical protein
VQIKRKRIRGESKRNVTYLYHIRSLSGTEIRVCKKAFCEVHDVGRKRVDDLCKKLSAGEIIVRDNRGKHTVRPHAISHEVREKEYETILLHFHDGSVTIPGEIIRSVNICPKD